MRCANRFQDDRTCDMCAIVIPTLHQTCKATYDEKIRAQKREQEIAEGCGFRYRDWDEYTPYWSCNLNPKQSCTPKESCTKLENYSKREGVK
jgi:hypothetical protein